MWPGSSRCSISASPGLAGDVDTIEEIIEQTAVGLTSSQGCGGIGSTEVPNNVYGWGRIDALAAFNVAADYRLVVDPETVAVCAPLPAIFDITVEQYQGFSEPVTLSTTGLPTGASAAFTPNPIVPPGAGTLTIDGTAAVAPGSHAFDLIGTSSPSAIVQEAPATCRSSTRPRSRRDLVSPADGALDQPTRPTFEWTEAIQAGTYTVEVDDDPSFASPDLIESGITDPLFTPATDLASNTVYHWRVTTENACGVSSPSTAFTLTTAALPGDCGMGTVPSVGYTEDFETGASGWSHSGTGDTWALSGARVPQRHVLVPRRGQQRHDRPAPRFTRNRPALRHPAHPPVLELAVDGGQVRRLLGRRRRRDLDRQRRHVGPAAQRSHADRPLRWSDHGARRS